MLTIRLGTAGFLRELEDLRLWPSIIANKAWINIAYPKGDYITTMRVYSLVGWSGC